MANFEEAYPFVYEHEKGDTNDKDDPGGATRDGISLRFLKSIGDFDGDGLLDGDFDHDGDVDKYDIFNMSPEQVEELYHIHFWNKYNLGLINDQKIATKILDMTVNFGTIGGMKVVQRACNRILATPLKVDGVFGKNTLFAINSLPADKLLSLLRSQCAIRYQEIIAAKPVMKKYWVKADGRPNGWQVRAYA